VFFLKLHYRSADLEVDRAKRFPQEPDQIELDSHDCIFTYEGARLARTKP
jgi:hypothetical protein